MHIFKNKSIFFSSLVGIILMYMLLSPMHDGHIGLNKNDYSLKAKNISKNNKWSKFENKGNGKFIVSPGEKKYVEGVIHFKREGNVLLDFSINKNKKVGNIEYEVNFNDTEIKKFVVTQKKNNIVLLNVLVGDWVTIKADRHNSSGHTSGNIKISIQDNSFLFQQYIIPFLWIILFVFLYGKNHILIGINAYFIFLLMLFAEKLNFGPMPFRTVITYSLIAITMVFLFILIYQELARKKFKIATILSYTVALSLYLIPMIFIIYTLAFDTKVTKSILYAILQSDSRESFEFIHQSVSFKWIILFVSAAGIIGFLLYRQEKKETEKINKSLLIFMITIFGTLSFTYEADLRLFEFVTKGFKTYARELRSFREVQLKRKEGDIKFRAEKNEKGETYIVVIGESLNKEHMGIYGYQRNTTPLLSKKVQANELLVFDKIYSNAVSTMPALSFALTEANQLNKKNYYESPSIVNILNQANIETYWVTNQQLQGVYDNLVSVVANEADYLVGLNHDTAIIDGAVSVFDAATVKEVKKILQKKSNKKNRVIFVHLAGNHWNYRLRYPKEYSIFKGSLPQGIFGRGLQKKSAPINHYDNSVLYNDFVVSSLLSELQKTKGVTGFLYFSDHAEDIFHGKGHNEWEFTFDMTQIPMIAWFSNDYKKRYATKYQILKNHLHTLYGNDLIYDTLIGIFNIKTDRYKSLYDLASKDYKLIEKDAYTRPDINRKRLFTGKSNLCWWQNKKTQYLIDNNMTSRVFPYRVNSVGKLKDIWTDGFRSFNIDMRFGDKNSSFFKLGHNHGVMGETFETYLSSVDYSNIERIRIDFKNLNEQNYKDAIKRLNYLDQRFQIKEKCIIESRTIKPFFKHIKKDSWHISYCIPTETIVKILNKKDIEGMKQLAQKIAKQSRDQDLSAVSFENRLYPFIKEYFEPLVSKNLIYHTKYGPALYKNSFVEDLNKNELFLDHRVKTILVKYKSPYDL